MPGYKPNDVPVKSIPHRLLPAGRTVALVLAVTCLLAATLAAQSPYSSTEDFAEHARLLRENALLKVEPQVFVPSAAPRYNPYAPAGGGLFARGDWKMNIITTVFNVGEQPTRNNPTPNHSSSWDSNWESNFGGFDDPEPSHRRGFLPAGFTPRQNPFYVALPYNDVTRGATKPEARVVIPWFRQAYVQEGHTVCKDHWVAIQHGNRVVYAQWEDCGPFRTDHYQYVFGADRPRPNLNGGAGLDVSPAVRDALGMNSTRDVCSWKFAEVNEVPPGPWRQYGDNNQFVNRSLNSYPARVQASGSYPASASGTLFGQH